MKEKVCFWIKNVFYVFLRILLLSLNICSLYTYVSVTTVVVFFFPLLSLVRKLIQKLFKIE